MDSSDDDDEAESQVVDAPDSPTVAASSNKVPPEPQDDAMTISSAQTEEIRDTAADRRFLEELGLTPQTFMALLDGIGIEWDDEDEDEDEDEDGDEDGGEN